MIIDRPRPDQTDALRRLWKESFGDTDAFLDGFYATAFSPDRCRFATHKGEVIAALYWFDCFEGDRRLAYLYAISTAKAYRGRGVCGKLMAHTHEDLKSQGYAGALLVPGSQELFDFYARMGYATCSHVREFSCLPSDSSLSLSPVDASTYAAQRRKLLPEGGIVQEGENLDFLQIQGALYADENFVLAARGEGDTLHGLEFLGDESLAPAITAALGYEKAIFRTAGEDRPFAMYLPLGDRGTPPPSYFGLAFD